jgi:hypothetical protein
VDGTRGWDTWFDGPATVQKKFGGKKFKENMAELLAGFSGEKYVLTRVRWSSRVQSPRHRSAGDESSSGASESVRPRTSSAKMESAAFLGHLLRRPGVDVSCIFFPAEFRKKMLSDFSYKFSRNFPPKNRHFFGKVFSENRSGKLEFLKLDICGASKAQNYW